MQTVPMLEGVDPNAAMRMTPEKKKPVAYAAVTETEEGLATAARQLLGE